MTTYRVSEGQCLFNVAIQKLGSAEAAFLLAMENGLSVTDEIAPGKSLEVVEPWNKKVAEYYKDKNVVPATYADSADPIKDGVEVIYWSSDLEAKTGIRVSECQSLPDVALQKCGSFEAVVELALLNGISITEVLTAGQQLELPKELNSDVTGYYAGKNIVPETAIDDTEESVGNQEGIGYWYIDVDFVVS